MLFKDYAAAVVKQNLTPAGSWFLWALQVFGPSTIADLAALGNYSTPALYKGAADALAAHLCDKDGTVFSPIPLEIENDVGNSDQKHKTTATGCSENREPDKKTRIKNREIIENEKSFSRGLSSSEAKPLSDKDLKEKSSYLPNNLDNTTLEGAQQNHENAQNDKNDEKSEKGGNSLLLKYCQDVLRLDRYNSERLLLLTGDNAGLITVLDAYRWQHVEGAGRPIGNVLSWARATLRNGVNKQPPEAFTFAAWARQQELLAEAARPPAQIQRERDAAARAKADARGLATSLRDEDLQRRNFASCPAGQYARMDKLKGLIDADEYERRFRQWRDRYVWARENRG